MLIQTLKDPFIYLFIFIYPYYVRARKAFIININTKFFLEFIYPLPQSDSTTSVLPLSHLPSGHLTMSADIFGCHTGEVTLASTKERPGMLLNILHITHRTVHYPPEKNDLAQMLVLLRLRNCLWAVPRAHGFWL